MKSTTLSLFEQEMRDQVAAARAALGEAERRGEPLLVQAAASHLDGLVDLARRNGVTLEDETPVAAAPAQGELLADPLPAPAG